jgi:hypothetical protein
VVQDFVSRCLQCDWCTILQVTSVQAQGHIVAASVRRSGLLLPQSSNLQLVKHSGACWCQLAVFWKHLKTVFANHPPVIWSVNCDTKGES